MPIATRDWCACQPESSRSAFGIEERDEPLALVRLQQIGPGERRAHHERAVSMTSERSFSRVSIMIEPKMNARIIAVPRSGCMQDQRHRYGEDEPGDHEILERAALGLRVVVQVLRERDDEQHFISSLGCSVNEPMRIHRCEPRTAFPSRNTSSEQHDPGRRTPPSRVARVPVVDRRDQHRDPAPSVSQ